jgi:hypothetical protein
MVVKGYEVVGTKVQSERWGQVDPAWTVTVASQGTVNPAHTPPGESR